MNKKVDKIPIKKVENQIPAKGWENIIGYLQKEVKTPIKELVKPNSQTDQSHPIPPDIIMDNQIPIKNKNIHNKHVYNSNLQNKHEYKIPQGWEDLKGPRAPNKNLQNEIQPQMPKIKKSKIKDTESLGGKIPIELLPLSPILS